MEGGGKPPPYFYPMKNILIPDHLGRVQLDAHMIYHWLVRVNEEGDYCFYITPWTEKIHFRMPDWAVRCHNEGKIKSIVLKKWPEGEWSFQTLEIYTHSFIKRTKAAKDRPSLYE